MQHVAPPGLGGAMATTPKPKMVKGTTSAAFIKAMKTRTEQKALKQLDEKLEVMRKQNVEALKQKDEELEVMRKQNEGLKAMAHQAHKMVIDVTAEMDIKREKIEELMAILKEKDEELWYLREQAQAVAPQMLEMNKMLHKIQKRLEDRT